MALLDSLLSQIGSPLVSKSNPAVDKVSNAFNKSFDVKSLFKLETFKLYNSQLIDTFSVENILKQENIEMINLALLNATISQISYEPIEEFSNNTWNYTMGKPVLKYLELTFRDYDNNIMYNSFKEAWWVLKKAFPDDQMWSIALKSFNEREINMYAEHLGNDNRLFEVITGTPKGAKILETTTAILESVSSSKLDRSDSDSLSQFTVRFKFFKTRGTN